MLHMPDPFFSPALSPEVNHHQITEVAPERLKQHAELLKPYLERRLRIKEDSDHFKRLWEVFRDCDRKGDYVTMRAGNVTKTEDLKSNCIERHASLAAAFLDPLNDKEGKDKEGWYEINFNDPDTNTLNKTANNFIGLGDIFTRNIEKVTVCEADGSNCRVGVRKIDPITKREGYFEVHALNQKPPQYEYLAVYHGYKVRPDEVNDPKTPEVQRAALASHVHFYGKGGSALDWSEMPGNGNEREPDSMLQAIIEESRSALSEIKTSLDAPSANEQVEVRGQRIVEAARFCVNNPEIFYRYYRNVPSLKNGNLGCALVASFAYQRAEELSKVTYSTDQLITLVEGQGYQQVQPGSQILPGALIMYDSLPNRKHKHAAIYLGRNGLGIEMVVDNNSTQKPPRPVERPLLRYIDGKKTIPRGYRVWNPPLQLKQQPVQKTKNGNVEKPSAALKSTERVVAGVLNRAKPYLPFIEKAAKQYGVPLEVLLAIFNHESGFKPDAVSHAGAVGIGQLMPATARAMGLIVNERVDQRFDPVANINASAKLIGGLSKRYRSDLALVLIAYNAGSGRVSQYLKQKAAGQPGKLPAETQKYVPRVIAVYNALKASRIQNDESGSSDAQQNAVA